MGRGKQIKMNISNTSQSPFDQESFGTNELIRYLFANNLFLSLLSFAQSWLKEKNYDSR